MWGVNPFLLFAGFVIDQVVGDPLDWPHPVIYMGKAIAWAEKVLNKGTRQMKRLKGALLTVALVGVSYALTAYMIWQINWFSPKLGGIFEAVLIASTLASKSLLDAGKHVLLPLSSGDMTEARKRLAGFVSRDTSQLSESEIARGTVETLAENYVDGILSPLFYLALGGAPLAMAFKAVSTLDSMIGYKNDRYIDFGWFAARTDDWANYLPARLSVLLLLIAGGIYGLPVKKAWQIWKRDAKAHPSPNGGNPESTVAGLLGIQLGGINIYHGRVQHRAEMGDPLHPLTWRDIQLCGKLVRMASWLGLALAVAITQLLP